MSVDSDTSGKAASQSWWHTLAGKITAVTAVIAALGALLATMIQIVDNPAIRRLLSLVLPTGGEADFDCQTILRPHMLPAGAEFQDCKCCPKMVVLPNGTAISAYEITKDEYSAFAARHADSEVSNTGHCYHYVSVGPKGGWQRGPREITWQQPGFVQEKDEPVVCVSWNDAYSYVNWLSDIAGTKYRIPTLEEMQYASGLSVANVFWTEQVGACAYANVHDEQSKNINPFPWPYSPCNDGFPRITANGIRQLAAKGDKYLPNKYGVFHIIGNVYEWLTTDRGCSTAGQVWIWGGSWTAAPDKAIAAVGWCQSREFKAPDIGIRVIWSQD